MKTYFVLRVNRDITDTYADTDLGVALSLTCADDGSTIDWGTVEARDAGAARISRAVDWRGTFIIEGETSLGPVDREHAARSETHPVLKAAALEGTKVRLVLDKELSPILEAAAIAAEEAQRVADRAKMEEALKIVEEGIYLGLKRDGIDTVVAGGATVEDQRRAWAKERARNIVSGLTALLTKVEE